MTFFFKALLIKGNIKSCCVSKAADGYEMKAGMTLHHTPAGMAMVRILIRTERAHLLKQKPLFFVIILHAHLDKAGGHVPTQRRLIMA